MSGLTDAGNFDAFSQPVVTTWNSSTPAGALGTGTAVTITTAGLDTIALTISAPAGNSGGVISFYAFDGAAFIPIKCPNISNYTTASSFTLSSNALQGFTVPIAGYPAFQYVLTTAITGGGNTLITTIASSAPDVSIVAAGIDPASTAQPVGSGSIATNQISVGTSATQIVAARTGIGSNGSGASGTGRTAITLTNIGSQTVFIGASGVTIATGLPLLQNTSVTIYTAAAVFGIVSATTATVGFLETF